MLAETVGLLGLPGRDGLPHHALSGSSATGCPAGRMAERVRHVAHHRRDVHGCAAFHFISHSCRGGSGGMRRGWAMADRALVNGVCNHAVGLRPRPEAWGWYGERWATPDP